MPLTVSEILLTKLPSTTDQYSQSDIQNAEGPAVNYIMNNGPRFTGTNKRKFLVSITSLIRST